MTIIHRDVELLRAGNEPRFVARMKSGWVVMGREQLLVGYCVLLPDPVVPDLNSLQPPERDQYLADMALLGDTIKRVTQCARINYAIFGNLEPALHAHVIPRFFDEPEEFRTKPYFAYDLTNAPKFEKELHDTMRDKISTLLGTLIPK